MVKVLLTKVSESRRPAQLPPHLLIVAAYDPSGGAGVLADTLAAHVAGIACSACLTALTVQSSRSIRSVRRLDRRTVTEQIRTLLKEAPPTAIKIGALAGSDQVLAISSVIRALRPLPTVLDPVIAPTRGAPFVATGDRIAYRNAILKHLLPNVTLLTPNLPEFRRLFGNRPPTEISQNHGVSILLKGGHRPASSGDVIDRLYTGGKLRLEYHRRRRPFRIHGTGCVLSTLIAAGLARGRPLVQAVRRAELSAGMVARLLLPPD